MRSNRNITFDCKYHVVFSPKYRRSVLVEGVDVRLKQIAEVVCEEKDADLIEMEVMPDHVHLLVGCDPQFGIHRLVKAIKGKSSKALREEFPWLKSRLPTLWTNAYFVGSVGSVSLDVVKTYVENQKNV
jgi:putative transposase